jgi:ABC-type branched-subunit amino acid transport system ATPase component
MTGRQLLADVHIHRQRVPAVAWREWAASDEMRRPLTCRLQRLGLSREAGALIAAAADDPGWQPLARLDAAVRLVILDEPFRGLERERRRVLLDRARRRWQSATLLCVTYDVGETLDFPRVLVLDGGRLVEDGRPGEHVYTTRG